MFSDAKFRLNWDNRIMIITAFSSIAGGFENVKVACSIK